MLVRVAKDWDDPDLFRQTPLSDGVWGDLQFTLEPVEECDSLIVLNRPKNAIRTRVPPGNSLLLAQEPPIPDYAWHRRSYRYFDMVLSQSPVRGYSHERSAQPALPWHIGKSFAELVRLDAPTEKRDRVSWVTSDAQTTALHRKRMEFKAFLESKSVDVAFFGRGFRPIDDKFDGIFPFKYSIAVENYSGPDYWSEKIADCFLSWTMPLYYGCTNITDYFPEESMIQLDLADFEGSLRRMQAAVAEDAWHKSLEAIAEARRRILFEYQFFPYVARMVSQMNAGSSTKKRCKTIPRNTAPYELNIFRRALRKAIRMLQ